LRSTTKFHIFVTCKLDSLITEMSYEVATHNRLIVLY